ncbi:MAG: ABC transporter permease, partial [Chloroflexi bacterium]|nr:ABC transporter permease [Chloroflexota bacterium]
LAVTTITLALGLYGPGDPAQVYLGKHSDPETVARIRQEWGLDQPFHIQLFHYIGDVLQGDFHESLVKFPGQKVSDLILTRLPVTVQLNALALVLGVLLGVPLGIVATVKHNRGLDYLISFGVIGAIAVPVFAITPFLQWILARELPLWTAQNLGVKIGLPVGGWDGLLSASAILPAMVLSPGYIAVFARQTRAGMVEALGQDFIRTAQAKGLRERLVVGRHAFRNALIPLVTIFGLALGGLVGGAIITETIFGIPGLGLLAYEALNARDYPIILGVTLMVAAAYITVNLMVDIAYRFIDPRIRYQ